VTTRATDNRALVYTLDSLSRYKVTKGVHFFLSFRGRKDVNVTPSVCLQIQSVIYSIEFVPI